MKNKKGKKGGAISKTEVGTWSPSCRAPLRYSPLARSSATPQNEIWGKTG
ncbi:MAG: hypothetical protein LBK25_07070 [Treponema sp.]|nr:hypothetical protein [Treponema sp.]